MNLKQFAILIVLLILLGGAGWYVQKSKNTTASAGEQGTGQTLFDNSFKINDIGHIRLAQGSNEVNLVKKQDVWTVAERKDYPANFPSISDFLIKLKDIKVVQRDEVGDSDVKRLQLAGQGNGTNTGLLVEFKGGDDKLIASLILGKKHLAKPTAQQKQFGMGDTGFPDGRYVQLGGNSKVAYLVADPMGSIEPKVSDWLNKEFFKIERTKAVSVTYANQTNSWAIARDTETGDWKLLDAVGEEKLDAARASGVSSPFSSPSFDDVVPPGGDLSGWGFVNPVSIKIETFDDFVYDIKIGAKSDEKYPITLSVTSNAPKDRVPAKDEKPEDKASADKAWVERQSKLQKQLNETKRFENWVFLVPSWTVDSVLKERKDILAEKKEAAKTASTPVSPPVETTTPEPFPVPGK